MPDTKDQKPLPDHAATLARPDVQRAEFEILYEQSLMPTAFVAEDGCFMSVNSAFAEMLGYSRLELIGRKKWQDVTHRDDIELNTKELEATSAGKQQCYRIQKRYLHKDGRYVYCVVQVARVPMLGEFIHFVKQAQEIPVASKSLTVERDENGNPVIVPTVLMGDFLKRNWKWFAGILSPFVVWIGATANDYYLTRAKSEYQQQEIKRLQEDLERQRARLDAHGVK